MTESEPATAGVRLQKVLAQAGYGSRRACEALIDAGRVEIDGQRVREQGRRVDPEQQVIRVDGERVVTAARLVHLAVHKPRGMVSTMSDPQGRPCVGDLVAGRAERLFHVGRLDADTEGLLLVMNDGELGHRLTHPSYGVSKTYLAEIQGPVARDVGRRLRAGVDLSDGVARADRFRVIEAAGGRVMVEVVLHEGRNHIVRRMLEAVGHPVRRLVRTEFGPISLGSLGAGRVRVLGRPEVSALYEAAGL